MRAPFSIVRQEWPNHRERLVCRVLHSPYCACCTSKRKSLLEIPTLGGSFLSPHGTLPHNVCKDKNVRSLQQIARPECGPLLMDCPGSMLQLSGVAPTSGFPNLPCQQGIGCSLQMTPECMCRREIEPVPYFFLYDLDALSFVQTHSSLSCMQALGNPSTSGETNLLPPPC